MANTHFAIARCEICKPPLGSAYTDSHQLVPENKRIFCAGVDVRSLRICRLAE